MQAQGTLSHVPWANGSQLHKLGTMCRLPYMITNRTNLLLRIKFIPSDDNVYQTDNYYARIQMCPSAIGQYTFFLD